MTSESGQGIAIDLLFAILVFLLLLYASLALLASESESVEDKALMNRLNAEAAQTVDMLARTGGEPNNWEELDISQVRFIGLAKRDRALDPAKVDKFFEWACDYGSEDYNKTRTLLLIGYDYYFALKDTTEQVIPGKETAKPSQDTVNKEINVTIRRIVNYDGGEVIAEFTLYFPR